MKKLKCLYIYIYISILCAIFSPCALQGQGQFTTLGDDFWLTFGNNYLNGSTLQLRFVASETTQVNLFFTANTALNRTINVAAGAVHTLSLNATEKAAVYNPTSATSWNSLHVTSNHNIALFAINIERATTDATNILPTNNLGTDYYHMSYQGVNGQGDGLCIVATENGTVINDAGTNVNLNAGQVYSRFFGTGVDNTGRHIISNRPIAYFTTNGCVTVPNGTPFCDCLYQQLVPVPLWGNNFLVPVTNRGRDRVRIIASQNTTINQTGGTVISGSLNLTAGQFVELEINQANNGCYIVANRPVAVGAYLMGADIFNLVGDARGDPAMAWIPPIQQSVAHTLMAPFIAINTSVLRIHYAMVIAPTAHRAATEVSESGGPFHGLGTTWTTNTASGYSYYSMPLADNVAASYEFRNPNGLMILGYGLGNDESYYYMAAASARQLDPAFYINSPNFPAEIHFQDANGQSYCNAPFTFRASIQYPLGTAAGRLKWYIGGPGGAGETEYMPARDLLEWTMPIDGLLGTHRIRLHITDSYNQTKDVITEFTVLPVPTAIPASDLSAAAICQNTAPTVRVANTNAALTYRVWNALTGGTNVGSAAGTGGTINIACTGNLSANTTYYVESFNGVCPSSPRTAVAIPVTTRPTVPALTAAAICNGSAPVIHLASSVSGVDYNVYTASTGGVAVGSASGTGSALDITLTETP
ncbi:MAG: hypothetical protein LBC98_08075, partial [Prevotellaceae bacterium]|nr:hypothetical protein [Prevotellaceae bacterium]